MAPTCLAVLHRKWSASSGSFCGTCLGNCPICCQPAHFDMIYEIAILLTCLKMSALCRLAGFLLYHRRRLVFLVGRLPFALALRKVSACVHSAGAGLSLRIAVRQGTLLASVRAHTHKHADRYSCASAVFAKWPCRVLINRSSARMDSPNCAHGGAP